VSRTDSASRLIAAPVAQVYAALVDPVALVSWMPPTGMTGRMERFDPRPGGTYRMVLTYTDSTGAPGKSTENSDVVDARFVEIVPGVRVSYAVTFVSEDPAFGGTMTMTWEVADVDGRTRVDVAAQDVPAGISPEDHATGMASSLSKLAEYVER
jgi:uncharacterized protein YndB with AHSA1/START domain